MRDTIILSDKLGSFLEYEAEKSGFIKPVQNPISELLAASNLAFADRRYEYLMRNGIIDRICLVTFRTMYK